MSCINHEHQKVNNIGLSELELPIKALGNYKSLATKCLSVGVSPFILSWNQNTLHSLHSLFLQERLIFGLRLNVLKYFEDSSLKCF